MLTASFASCESLLLYDSRVSHVFSSTDVCSLCGEPWRWGPDLHTDKHQSPLIDSVDRNRTLNSLTLLTVGPRSTSVYRYSTAVSRQLEFVVYRQSEPQRGAEHLLSHVFSPVAGCPPRESFKTRSWGLIAIRRSATDRVAEKEVKKIGNACDA